MGILCHVPKIRLSDVWWSVFGAGLVWVVVSLAYSHYAPPHPIRVHVRWRPLVTASERAVLEGQLGLASPELEEGTTYKYVVAPDRATLRALVEHPAVEDTAHVHRTKFRPSFREDPVRQRAYASALAAALVAPLIWWRRRRNSSRVPTLSV